MRVACQVLASVLVGAGCLAQAASGGLSARLEVPETNVRLGAPFDVEIRVRVPDRWIVAEELPGPALGDVSILDGRWEEPVGGADAPSRIWRGRMAAFRLGEVTVPPLRVTVLAPDGSADSISTEPLTLSVLGELGTPEEGSPPPELADLKPPVAVAPDYRGVVWALTILAAVAGIAALLWWIQRRWRGRLARVPVDTDPFRRMAPDAWAYEALGQLVGRGLGADVREDAFHAELASIVKHYLSGRYRVDLRERTTGELAVALRQAGMETESIEMARSLMERADLAKFARVQGGAEACREAVEAAYALVDKTRPAPARADSGEAA